MKWKVVVTRTRMQGISIHTIKGSVENRIDTLENLITEMKKIFQGFIDHRRKGNIKRKQNNSKS